MEGQEFCFYIFDLNRFFNGWNNYFILQEIHSKCFEFTFRIPPLDKNFCLYSYFFYSLPTLSIVVQCTIGAISLFLGEGEEAGPISTEKVSGNSAKP